MLDNMSKEDNIELTRLQVLIDGIEDLQTALQQFLTDLDSV